MQTYQPRLLADRRSAIRISRNKCRQAPQENECASISISESKIASGPSPGRVEIKQRPSTKRLSLRIPTAIWRRSDVRKSKRDKLVALRQTETQKMYFSGGLNAEAAKSRARQMAPSFRLAMQLPPAGRGSAGHTCVTAPFTGQDQRRMRTMQKPKDWRGWRRAQLPGHPRCDSRRRHQRGR